MNSREIRGIFEKLWKKTKTHILLWFNIPLPRKDFREEIFSFESYLCSEYDVEDTDVS